MSLSVKSAVEMFENLGKEKDNQSQNSSSKEEIKRVESSENIEIQNKENEELEEDELEQLKDIEPWDEEVDEEKKREEMLDKLKSFDITIEDLEEELKEIEEEIKELEGDKVEQLYAKEDAELYKLTIDLAKEKEKLENYLGGGELSKEGYELLEEFSKKYDFLQNYENYTKSRYRIWSGESENYDADLKELESSVNNMLDIDLQGDYSKCRETAKVLGSVTREVVHSETEKNIHENELKEEKVEVEREYQKDKIHYNEIEIDLLKTKGILYSALTTDTSKLNGEMINIDDFLFNWKQYYEAKHDILSGQSKNYGKSLEDLELSVAAMKKIDLPDELYKQKKDFAEKGEAKAKKLMDYAEEVIHCEIEIEGLKYALENEKEEAMREYLKDKIHFWEMNLNSVRKEEIYLYEPKDEIERENTRVFQSLWEKYSDVKYLILSGKSENYSEDLEDLEAIVARIKSIDLPDEIYKQKKEIAEKGEAKVKETLHLNKMQENEKKQEVIKITPILNNTEEVTVDYIKQRKAILNQNIEEIEKHHNTLDTTESKSYDNYKKSYDLAEKGYNKAEKEYNEAEKRYTQAEKKEEEANKEYNEAEKEVTKAKEKEKGADEKYNEAHKNELKAFNDMSKANQDFNKVKYEYYDAKRVFDTIDGEYKRVKRKYNVAKKQYEETEKKYNEAKGKYNETDRNYKEAEKDYKEAEKNYKEVEEKYNEVEKNYKKAEGKYTEVEKKKNEIEKKYNEAKIELDEKRNAKYEAMDSKRKVSKERIEAEGKFNDAKSKKNEAEREKRGASANRSETYKQLQKEEAWLIDKYSAFGNAIERIGKGHKLEQGVGRENTPKENKTEKLNESQSKSVSRENLAQQEDRVLKRTGSDFSDGSIINLSQLQKNMKEAENTVAANEVIINNLVEVKKTKEVMINYQDKTISYKESKDKTVEEKKNDTKLVALKIVEGFKKQTKDMSDVQSVNVEYSGGLYKLEVNKKDNSSPEVYKISRDDFERSGTYKFGKPEAPNMFLNSKISKLDNVQKLKMSELSNKIKELEAHGKQHNKDKDTGKNYFTK